MNNTLEERTQGEIFLEPTSNLEENYIYFSLHSGKKITRRQFREVPTPTIFMKQVEAMASAKKQNKGLIFENRTDARINDIWPDDKANEAFNKIDRNISGVDLEAEIQELTSHIPQLKNNQYSALAGKEGNEDNDTESTGVENDGEITGV